MENQNNQNYYIGLDIGTDSVGYAVTDTQYHLCKYKGEPMWGVTLFEKVEDAKKRRTARIARRRVARRRARLHLLSELFSREIAKVDPDFFRRIRESYRHPEEGEEPIRLFGDVASQKAYSEKYPTIHRLICELMKSDEPHDVRLVYIAAAWLIAHRGHFLYDVDKDNAANVTDPRTSWDALHAFLTRDGLPLAWDDSFDTREVQAILGEKTRITERVKKLTPLLFPTGDVPKEIDETHEYAYPLIIKLLCGGEVPLKGLFGKEEYADLARNSIALGAKEEEFAEVVAAIGDDGELLLLLKRIYDQALLASILEGASSLSEAKDAVYEQHGEDLERLRYFVRKYLPKEYNGVFRTGTTKASYAAYVGKAKVKNKDIEVKNVDKEEFFRGLTSLFKNVTPDEEDRTSFDEMCRRIEARTFLPKQVDGDNRLIPYQLTYSELSRVLKRAEGYLPFLKERDEDNVSVSEKVLSLLTFKIPYFVGPLKENPTADPKRNYWLVRRAQGRIYPWNFSEKVDLDKSEEAFIARMTNTCTYLPGEPVLPRYSLRYVAFDVLNTLNCVRVDGLPLPVKVKQAVYRDVFLKYEKVTPKKIFDYLVTQGYIEKNTPFGGVDERISASLKPFLKFSHLIEARRLTCADAEQIIARSTCCEDRHRYARWVKTEFPQLEKKDADYIASLRFKDFGRFSARFLTGLYGTNKETGETYSILHALWETDCNLMQLLSDRFTFREQIEAITREYYDAHPQSISDRLCDLRLSGAVKRPVLRTLDRELKPAQSAARASSGLRVV